MDLPRYCIMGARPVKLVKTQEGGMDVLAYQWDTGKFARDMSYMTRAVIGEEDMDIVSLEEFKDVLKGLRRALKKKWEAEGKSGPG